ncbi:hypothetical protein OG883_23535 [Streptomyces sp. NBC_01142]|uniref:hypothetical protein n=1 Tax=Streptomyces sp. NBC_01142 TaxID=2975865 RepID=UPI002254AE18|nr:hypothetical protein [Streptomyces sp. NBC_01142]MCX4822815.1 hypothetical protein [Streptomyces sp. NBC_01142]
MLQPDGCVGPVCDVVEYHPVGSTHGLEPVYWWINEAGKPVTLATGQPRPDVRGLPPVDIISTPAGHSLSTRNPVDRKRAWRRQEQEYDLNRPAFRIAAVTSDAVWVASDLWKGKEAALVRLNPKSGAELACHKPSGGPITHLSVADDYLITNDIRIAATETAEPEITMDKHPFLLMRPAERGNC